VFLILGKPEACSYKKKNLKKTQQIKFWQEIVLEK